MAREIKVYYHWFHRCNTDAPENPEMERDVDIGLGYFRVPRALFIKR